jgi:hypothetical protein
MKLNFWQWIGVVLVLGVIVWFIYEKTTGSRPAASQPSSRPAGGY